MLLAGSCNVFPFWKYWPWVTSKQTNRLLHYTVLNKNLSKKKLCPFLWLDFARGSVYSLCQSPSFILSCLSQCTRRQSNRHKTKVVTECTSKCCLQKITPSSFRPRLVCRSHWSIGESSEKIQYLLLRWSTICWCIVYTIPTKHNVNQIITLINM